MKSRDGISVKVETRVTRAAAVGNTVGEGWVLWLACGHTTTVKSGPAPVDAACPECETIALDYVVARRLI
jgi:hypothetical protein